MFYSVLYCFTLYSFILFYSSKKYIKLQRLNYNYILSSPCVFKDLRALREANLHRKSSGPVRKIDCIV